MDCSSILHKIGKYETYQTERHKLLDPAEFRLTVIYHLISGKQSPIIKKLELENQKQTGYKARTKAIESEIKDINEKAEKLVDLYNQINLG